MAIDRRSFTAGLAALGFAGFLPAAGYCRGAKGYVTCGRDALSGRYLVARLSADYEIEWELPLPARGHDVVLSPTAGEGVAMARRPGVFAIVFDTRTGALQRRIDAEPGRLIYGHGAYSADGRTFWMTENAYDEAVGVIGVYDVAAGYRRIGEMPSGGLGPHEVILMADGETLCVANGGIRTHPDTGRKKLNLDDLHPTLAYVDATAGEIRETVGLGAGRAQKLSIRHVALTGDGRVAAVCQDQADDVADAQPLVYVHSPGKGAPLRALEMPVGQRRHLNGYCGSVAADPATGVLAVTSPRGGTVAFWRLGDDRFLGSQTLADGCGLAAAVDGAGFTVSSGDGTWRRYRANGKAGTRQHAFRQWDNHMAVLV